MKKIYFSIDNGKAVNPYSILPPYYTLVKNGVVKEIYLCFSVSNISENGSEWVKEQLLHEKELWKEKPNLKKSLTKLVRQPSLWLKDTNHEESSYDRFIFIRFY